MGKLIYNPGARNLKSQVIQITSEEKAEFARIQREELGPKLRALAEIRRKSLERACKVIVR